MVAALIKLGRLIEENYENAKRCHAWRFSPNM